MKMSIGQIKLLFWADKVVSYAHNEDANWADKVVYRVNEVVSWAQREVAIRVQIKAVVKMEIKLFSFFLLLACLLCLCLLCCCSKDEQYFDGGCIWWDHLTAVQKSSLRGISTVIKKVSLLT